MLTKLLPGRPRHATVVAYLALFIALGGTGAYAAATIGARDIERNAVRTKHIKGNAVTGAKVRSDSLTGADIKEPSLKGVVRSDTAGVPIAGANVAGGGAVRAFFNRAGGRPTVNKRTGVYNITFPGLIGKAAFNNAIALVSLNSSAGEITRDSSFGNPQVSTFDSAGNPADRSFEIVIFKAGGL